MKNVKVVLGIVLVLLLAGCASSTPDYDYLKPTHKFINLSGKTYRVPKNAQHYERIGKKEAKSINRLYGIDCKDGDIWWYTKDAYSEIYKSIKTNNQDMYFQTLDKYIPKHKIDVARPLTKKELQYYKQKNVRKQQLIQSQLEYLQKKSLIREMNAPKTYNVNVYHY